MDDGTRDSNKPRIPQSSKDMSLSEFESFVDQVMELFRELEDLSDLRTLYENGKALSQAYFNGSSYRNELSCRLIKQGYPDFATKMLKKLNNLGVFKNDDIWFSSFYFYNTCWNYSDAEQGFASALAAAGLPSLLKLNIAHKPYLDNMQSRNVTYLLKATVSIIHNIVRNPANTHYFNEKPVKESLMALLTNENEMIHGLALSCLAYLVQEDETWMLERGSSSVHYLVQWLDHALHKSPEKRRCRGFTPEEIASSLAALAVNDNLKKSIADEASSLACLIEMAKGSRIGETRASLKALWNLAYDQDVFARLMREFDLESTTKRISEVSEDEEVRKAAASITWMIEKRRVNSETVSSSQTSGDRKPYVFISYSWVDQALTLKVRERLRQENIECWIDVEQMQQSTLDSMANGIEGSSAVMVCMSDSYKSSANCRMEVTYAHQIKRPLVPVMMRSKYKPDGYLGLLFGDRLYFDVGGRRPFDQAMAGLVRELRTLLGLSERSSGLATVDGPSAAPACVEDAGGDCNAVDNKSEGSGSARVNGDVAPPAIAPTAGPGAARVRSWRPEEVAAWLDRCQLGHVKLSMGQIDGELLTQMAKLRRESPDFFFKSLDRKLGLTFVDSLRFVGAMDKLAL